MSTILIVDPEPTEIEQLQAMLDREGHRFISATTPEEAKETVRTQGSEISGVLLDWMISNGEGIELLQWMKSRPELADVEVVVESSEFVKENVRTAIECGAYYYLTKPFHESRVVAIVRAAVASCEIKRSLAEKAEETQDAFQLLDSGRFHVRRVREAELLAVHISSGCGQPDASIGLLELLVNAVEHGNLEITYEEKGTLIAEKRLSEERRRRAALPEYRDRRVQVDLKRVADTMEIRIRDAGKGFDFERYLKLDKSRLFDAHGRGILLASSTLNISYTPPGNRVSVSLPVQA